MTTRMAGIAALAVLLTAALAGCAPAGPEATDASAAPATQAAVSVGTVAVVGDSMSLAVNACASAGPCPESSWATGDDPAVDSVVTRLTSMTSAAPAVESFAKIGARVRDGAGAVPRIVDSGADLVLVLIGANDACAPSVDAVTPPADFAAAYRQLLDGIHSGLPDARIVALSVPNLLMLWDVSHGDAAAVKAWNSSPSCRSLLGDADSDAPADQARRAAIDADVQAYNAAIVQACSAIDGCYSDGGAVYDTVFTPAQISTIDHFHASESGQAAIVDAAWPTVEEAVAP